MVLWPRAYLNTDGVLIQLSVQRSDRWTIVAPIAASLDVCRAAVRSWACQGRTVRAKRRGFLSTVRNCTEC